jgi:1-deoxy-D-xylulose-5-phosphate synthase
MMVDAMAITTGPVAIRWPKTAARSATEVGSGLDARLVRDGDGRVCLIGVGKMLEACEEAADILAESGIDATVWDPRIVSPLESRLLDHAAEHRWVITVEDGLRTGGAGTNIRDALGERNADCRVRVLGVPVAYIPHAKPAKILAELGLDGPGVAAAALEVLGVQL